MGGSVDTRHYHSHRVAYLILVLVLATLLVCAQLPQPVPTIPCKLSHQRPMIDGRLDDECWKRAMVVSGFHLLGRRGLASQQTECMVSYDGENLYVAFICHESDLSGIRRLQHLRDGPLWQDDCVEVYIDPQNSHRNYFHLITNFNGARFDQKGNIGVPVPNPGSWDGDWKVGVATFSGGWTVEIGIPFSSMGLTTPQPGSVWGFNLDRQEQRIPELSSWSENLYWFHEPWNFGRLLFVPSF